MVFAPEPIADWNNVPFTLPLSWACSQNPSFLLVYRTLPAGWRRIVFEGSGPAEWGAFIDSAWSLKTGIFQIATKWSNWYFSKDGFLENWHVEEIGSDLFILLKICVLVG